MVAQQEPLNLSVLVTAIIDTAEIDVRNNAKNGDNAVTKTKPALSPSSSTTSSKSVQFNSTVFVRTTIHVDDYSDEEYERCWYQSNEVAEFKKENAQTVSLVESGLKLNEATAACTTSEGAPELCMRGLEGRTKRGSRRRRDNKYKGMCAVMDEQDRQLETLSDASAVLDDEAIREKYVEFNRRCSSEAYAAGLSDQMEALRIFGEEEDCPERKQQIRRVIRKMAQFRKQILEEAKALKRSNSDSSS